MATTTRLQYLRSMLVKYAPAYYRAMDSGRELSSRMYSWIDEYNDARDTPAWNDYCATGGFDPQHEAVDNFA